MKLRGMHPEAVEEFREAAGHYERQQSGLGDRFKKAVIEVADRLQSSTSDGAPWIHKTRIQTLHKFPYGIVYRDFTDRIYIYAVYHFSRREDYWVQRLDDVTENE